MEIDLSRYRVKLAETETEIAGAQRLRYRVFVEEMGAAASPAEHAARREWDAYDPHFDHLVLVDRTAIVEDPLDRVVGVYRLMRAEAARAGIGFYGATEYDLGPLLASGREVVELGRSCVAAEHRGGPAMHLLWNGLAEYVLARRIEILFGVASFPGTDPEPIAEALSHLHHAHLAPEDLRVRAWPEHRLEMDRMAPEAVDAPRALQAIPPLIKAYLRLGGFVGEGAHVDRAFNTIDVCLIMDTARMVTKYRRFYERGRVGGGVGGGGGAG
jgi:L-ornithine Nalpha-acyltransferase